MLVETLNKEEILRIHDRLAEDFAASEDPISPPGLKSEALLDSAIGRQFVSLGDQLKYPGVHENAATLMFGICLDHPFHNGNKRTALVSMLVHLDKNHFTLFGVTHPELYQMIIQVADHSFGFRGKSLGGKTDRRRHADEEVSAIADWIKRHMSKLQRGERRNITYRQLRGILGEFGFVLENPKNNSIEVVKTETRAPGFFRRQVTVRKKSIGSIGYPGDTRYVSVNELKRVRRMCDLTAEKGIDSSCFYDAFEPVDYFMNEYRTILRRLART